MDNRSSKRFQPVEVLRPEEILERYYDRLQQWAAGLTRGDVSAAQDVVHDLYLYMTLARPDLSRVENLDKYLYQCLRNIHRSHLSHSSRWSLEQAETVDFDSLQLALWVKPDGDPLNRQNDLRRICNYTVWRKAQAKSASFFILRFFHGYHLKEIADLAGLSLAAVQPKLSKARTEIQACLDEPDKLPLAVSAMPAEPALQWSLVPSATLFRELRETILKSRKGECLEEHELLAYYNSATPKALSCSLLSHIVSCDRCLSIVDRHFRRPTLKDREPLDGLASASKGTRRKGGAAMRSPGHKELLRTVLKHRDDVYDHRPRRLSIAVDGKIIASQQVQAQRSVQSARIERPENAGCVEIFSEQGLRLVFLLLNEAPPDGPHTQTQRVELSDGRWVEVSLSFDSLGLSSEVTYFDPALIAEVVESASEDETAIVPIRIVPTALSKTDGREDEPPVAELTAASRRRSSWWRQILDRMTSMALPEMNPMLATATVCGVLAIILFTLAVHRSSVMRPGELLTRASDAAAAPTKSGQAGVIMQTVRIQTPHRKLERTIYRDVEGRRHLKPRVLEGDDARLQDTLATAGVSWDDPLSAVSFDYWRQHEAVQREVVKRSGDGLLTVTTAISGSPVTSESLTVRESDFHAVARTIELRDQGTVQIAEVSYGVFPWNSVNPDLFEPSSFTPSPANSDRRVGPLPHIATLPTEMQLDEAELATRLVLNHLQLDDNPEITVHRELDAVHVQAVVASPREKENLQRELRLVPHVITAVSTMAELNTLPSAGSEITKVKQSFVSNQPAPLERLLAERGMDHTQAGSIAQQLINSSFTAKHESQALAELLDHFAHDTQLSPSARTSLSQLIVQHKAALLNALQTQQRELIALNIGSEDIAAATGPMDNDAEALRAAAEKNFSLCMELTLNSNDSSRPAQTIAPQLVASIAQLRAATLRISAASQLSTAETAPPHESR